MVVGATRCRYVFYQRYDTPPQLRLNELWQLVNDCHNYLNLTKQPHAYLAADKARSVEAIELAKIPDAEAGIKRQAAVLRTILHGSLCTVEMSAPS